MNPHAHRTAALSLFALGALVLQVPLHAQIVADPSAPGSQRPTILQTANGVPQVNIQTPSPAGVSRNTYSQFDVDGRGAILNNSRTNVQTQLGGMVAAIPWISTPARVILNEVNSSNPSYLKGYVEVAGQRAEVIIANPAGIQVSGGGFINASGVTLTTGTPVMNSGNLESFRVQRGQVTIDGTGLDTSTADYTRILARAMQVNAGLWAKDLTVVTGSNDVKALASGADATATKIAGTGAAPTFMLDVAAIGGMYAGHIYVVGTEAGLGVNNRGSIAAQEGNWVLRADGWLVNTGKLQAKGDLTISTIGAISNTGPDAVISSQGKAALTAGTTLANTGEATFAATGTLDVISGGALTNTGSTLVANGAVRITAAGIDNTAGMLASVQSTLDVNAANQAFNNTQGTISAAQSASIASGALNNDQGLIQAGTTLAIDTHGQTLTNTHSGATGIVAAGTLNLAAGDLNNSAGYIGAGGNLSAATGQITNTAGGQIASEANLQLAASALNNQGGKVQALGNLGITAANINNAGSTIEANVNSDYASVTEQSGIKAGDGGFQVNVGNNTDLKGGVIASSQSAVEQGKNSFNTDGTLTTSDVQNQASYSANSTSVGVGTGGSASMLGISGVGVGVGSDKGSASSTTQAGISGVAGNTSVRSTDAETGIQKIFDQERVQREVDAQVKITQEFGRNASKAIGDYAAGQIKQAQALRAQANDEPDLTKKSELNAQAEQLEAEWGDLGWKRALAHTVVGGLTGGTSGALGAAAGTLSAPVISAALTKAGIDGPLASTLTGLGSTLIGASAVLAPPIDCLRGGQSNDK